MMDVIKSLNTVSLKIQDNKVALGTSTKAILNKFKRRKIFVQCMCSLTSHQSGSYFTHLVPLINGYAVILNDHVCI